MVLYDHLVICPSCKGAGASIEEKACPICLGKGMVTPDLRRYFMDAEFLECGRCGRKLIDSKSRERGYGPVCWEKVQKEREEDDQ